MQCPSSNGNCSHQILLASGFDTEPRPSTVHGYLCLGGGATGGFLSGWYFQLWHRDAVGGQTTSNFTDAVAVTFQ